MLCQNEYSDLILDELLSFFPQNLLPLILISYPLMDIFLSVLSIFGYFKLDFCNLICYYHHKEIESGQSRYAQLKQFEPNQVSFLLQLLEAINSRVLDSDVLPESFCAWFCEKIFCQLCPNFWGVYGVYVDEILVQLIENRPQKQVQERFREYIR